MESPLPGQVARGQSVEIQPEEQQLSAWGAVCDGLIVRHKDFPDSCPHVNPESPGPSVHMLGAGRGGSQGALCTRPPPYLTLRQDGDLGWRWEDRRSVSQSHFL